MRGGNNESKLLPSNTSVKTADGHKKKLPSLKKLRAEYAKLLSEEKAAYAENYKVKDEYHELMTCPACSAVKTRKTNRRKITTGRKISASRCAAEDKIFNQWE